MKKIFCLLAAAVLISSAAFAASVKTVEVSTAQEFLDAIASDRIIVVKESFEITPALLDARNSKLKVSYERAKTTSKKVFFVEETDGPELHIANVKNLSIIAGEDVIVLMASPRYADVISFDRCSGITLKGLTIGHTEEGYCDKGVLGFDNCSHVLVDRGDLYGCGTEGVGVYNCVDVTFKATKIHDCTYHIMHLSGSNYVLFDGCQFFRNREFEQVNISGCKNVEFDNCMFANNTGNLFNVSCPVTMRDCVLLHDGMFWGDTENINFINCVFDEYFNPEQALG
ncbi:MAG: right-handed parallel beta-helix repeat-containing protein [Bacteroidales bacterium]|nr:right-handed parallel beta-helix repeat-containing protein [Bacteroidales bacterium]